MLARLNVILGFLMCVPLFYLDLSLPWTTVGVVVLIGLISVGRVAAGKVGHVAEVADSLYFLGFSITLLSLFVAFYRLSISAIDYERADQAMLALFGVIGSGLSTTIAGVLMRELVYLAGARRETIDIGEVTSEELRSVVDRLNAALRIGEEAVEVSRVAAGSADRYRETFDTYSETLSGYSEHLSTFQRDVLAPMTGMKGEVEATLADIASQLRSANTVFAESSRHMEGTGQQVAQLGDQVEKLNATMSGPTANLAQALDAANQALVQLSGRYDALSSALSRDFRDLDAIADALPRIASGLQDARKGSSELQGASRSFDQLRQAIERLGQTAPAVLDRLERGGEKAASGLDQLNRTQRQLTQAIADDIAQISAVAGNLPDEKKWKALDYLADSLPGLNASLQSSGKIYRGAGIRLENASQTFEETQALLRDLAEAMNARAMDILDGQSAPGGNGGNGDAGNPQPRNVSTGSAASQAGGSRGSMSGPASDNSSPAGSGDGTQPATHRERPPSRPGEVTERRGESSVDPGQPAGRVRTPRRPVAAPAPATPPPSDEVIIPKPRNILVRGMIKVFRRRS